MPGPYDNDDIFKVMVQRSKSQTTFPDTHFLAEAYTAYCLDGSPSNVISFCFILRGTC